MDEKEFKEFLKKQISIEHKIVERAESNSKMTRNRLIGELIKGIGYDSLKHANLLEALLALVESRTPMISEEESEEFINGIKEHLKMEKEAIETYSKLLEKIEDQKTRLIITYILEDEKRHHALLKKIEDLIIKRQTLTEEDLFELVWQFSVTHGSPGG